MFNCGALGCIPLQVGSGSKIGSPGVATTDTNRYSPRIREAQRVEDIALRVVGPNSENLRLKPIDDAGHR